ncbi:hypothetical protein D3Y59_12410 [Hymenobacter oligotrophus]|uniref:STAS/SEC14 domain-containing protein n=1 Tax=Hymenobacter oligotrophus TaxID=2319843 RepID=A0A3B7REU3_9BACT|nr:hypothetical protein [Hymenobacter oligotrophus]AYA37776.1 hypothetical protein D3Y59_12410 [Hymenobacter oligotrophus]
MELQLIVRTDLISISYDAANAWLYADWRGEHNQETSQAGCMLMLQALRQQPCAKILNDNSGITRTTVQPTLWGAWWLEEMMRAGLEHVAWVMPREFEARRLTESMLLQIKKPVVGTFDDVATAYVWLQRQSQRVPNHPMM